MMEYRWKSDGVVFHSVINVELDINISVWHVIIMNDYPYKVIDNIIIMDLKANKEI